MVLGLLDPVTPGDIYQCITNNSTISQIGDEDWNRYAGFAKKAHIENLDWDKFMVILKRQLQRWRLDLYGILDNSDAGWRWLDGQMVEIRRKLGC